MPLVANTELPTFGRLRGAGQEVLPLSAALRQDIRELHVGLLNMMPDAALEATERQFMRLVGASNRIAQFYVHPFTMPGLERQGRAAELVSNYYASFDDVQRDGLDALIITGANPIEADITREPYWNSLLEVMDWARDNVSSTVMSCLASHAAFKRYYGVERVPFERKVWGVYSHRVCEPAHPLTANVNTRFEAPHSRWNGARSDELRAAGIRILVEGERPGMLVATSPDGISSVYLQGHPEYDRASLLKEYKREVDRFTAGVRDVYPPFPENYFGRRAAALLAGYELRARRERANAPPFPEAELLPLVDNTWTDTGKALFNNWLGSVYRITDYDRRRPFAPGIDPDDPLGLAGARAQAVDDAAE